MAFTCGFYNSIDEDRPYDATQMSSLFDGIINDGIFMSVGTQLMSTPTTPASMQIEVGEGRAWLFSTWSWNDEIMYLDVPEANLIMPRIDTVVLEVNKNEYDRTNTIKIVEGTAASAPVRPVLINTNYVKQYPLADIYVSTNATEISASDITNRVGIDVPFVTGVLETMDISGLIAQWGQQWLDFMADKENSWDTWSSEKQAEYVASMDLWIQNYKDSLDLTKVTLEEFATEQMDSFTAWYDQVKQLFVSEDFQSNLS